MTDLLVIAPHPDDEILGAGATMARAAREGRNVEALFVSEGAFPFEDGMEVRRDVMEALGHPWQHYPPCLAYNDQRFDTESIAKMAEAISAVVEKLQPRTVLLPFYGDINKDHQVTYEAGSVACRPFRHFIERVMCYETSSSTEWGYVHPFRPNHYVEVSREDMRRKIEALKVYGEQMKDFPHPRSYDAVHAKAMHRGSEMCVPLAEAFMIVQSVERL